MLSDPRISGNRKDGVRVVIAFAAAIFIVIAYFVHGFRAGWASVFVLILISTGAILTSHGITGVLIGKIFEQTKERPLYLVRDRLNFPDDALAEAKLVSSKGAVEGTSALRLRTMPIK